MSQTTLHSRGLAGIRVRDKRPSATLLVFGRCSCAEDFPSVPPVVLLDVTHLILPHTLLCIIMLRNTLRQCSRQLQSCPAKARLSTIAASPARTNAISSCRRPLAVAQRRSYALAAEDTDKGVVRRHTRSAPAAKVSISSLPLTMTT